MYTDVRDDGARAPLSLERELSLGFAKSLERVVCATFEAEGAASLQILNVYLSTNVSTQSAGERKERYGSVRA